MKKHVSKWITESMRNVHANTSIQHDAFRDFNALLDQFYQPAEVDEKAEAQWAEFFTNVVKYQPREPGLRLFYQLQLVDKIDQEGH